MMKEQEAINYLENLESGNYVTINIPLFKDEGRDYIEVLVNC